DFASGTSRQSQLQSRLNATYSILENRQFVGGKGEISNLAGMPEDVFPRGFQAGLNFDISPGVGALELRQVAARFSDDGAAAGEVEFKGRYNPKAGKGDFALKLTGLNQHALGPFLAGALAPRRLASAALNGTATAKLETGGKSGVEAEVTLDNLVTVGT